ncbi:hypothetical protein ACLUWZ_09505, partial [Limosilactobacillus mucosae]|uniref:hypothetical protein n=1 Tax=Limosilactobacillus mucosae TaxID=97478 RepID=UPI003991F7E1
DDADAGVDTVTAPPNMIPDNTAHIAVAFLIFTILPLFQYFLSTDYYSYLCKRIQTLEFIEVLAHCIFFHLSNVIWKKSKSNFINTAYWDELKNKLSLGL